MSYDSSLVSCLHRQEVCYQAEFQQGGSFYIQNFPVIKQIVFIVTSYLLLHGQTPSVQVPNSVISNVLQESGIIHIAQMSKY